MGGVSGKKGRKINDDGAVGGGGGVEGALDHKARCLAFRRRGEKKSKFCQFMQTVRLVLQVTLKPEVNEAASLWKKRE